MQENKRYKDFSNEDKTGIVMYFEGVFYTSPRIEKWKIEEALESVNPVLEYDDSEIVCVIAEGDNARLAEILGY